MKNLNDILNESILADDTSLDKRKVRTVKVTAIKEIIDIIDKIIEEDKPKKGSTIDLNFIDTSEITSLRNLSFLCNYNSRNYNYDVSEWNVSNVTNFSFTFKDLKYFDCDLSKWRFNTQNNIYLTDMFYGCTKFKGKGLENWNTEKFYNAAGMFKKCGKRFKPNISNWNTSNLASAKEMFTYNDDAQRKEIGNMIKNWDLTTLLGPQD